MTVWSMGGIWTFMVWNDNTYLLIVNCQLLIVNLLIVNCQLSPIILLAEFAVFAVAEALFDEDMQPLS